MKYDFTSILDRAGKDALAVDVIPFPNAKVQDGFDKIPMWVADMNFPTLPAIQKKIMERVEHPAFGYYEPSKEYYESIEPEKAEELYKQVVEQLQEEEQIQEYAATYSNMKPKNAAAIFNTMGDDLELVGKILWAMDAQSRGDILGAMDADLAAAVTKLMEP